MIFSDWLVMKFDNPWNYTNMAALRSSSVRSLKFA